MRQQHLLLLAALAIATTSSACTVLVDGALQDRDSGVGLDVNLPDAFLPDVFVPTTLCEMAGVNDGDYCSLEGSLDLRVCDNRLCVRSFCGDGLVDDRTTMPPAGNEQCDDANDVSGDGCEADCSFTCAEAADCEDMNPCTDDACTAMHTCTNTPNTAACSVGGVTSTCAAGVCPAANCGNGTRDAGELCDDGNMVAGDGCERDCTPSCTADSQCDDGAACNGVETCSMPPDGARRCVVTPGSIVACVDDGNACTIERCETAVGCVTDTSTNDADADGHYAMTCTGGDDCDDTSAARHPGNAEVCGNGIDDDCSATTADDTRTAYFADCDRDRYAASMTGSMLVCDPPSSPPSTCAGGGWTPTSPVNAETIDCNPGNVDVNPGQTRYFTMGIPGASSTRDFDYNCDGMETAQYTTTTGIFSCFEYRGSCLGSSYYQSSPVCGMSNRVNRCVRLRTGLCGYELAASALVACR